MGLKWIDGGNKDELEWPGGSSVNATQKPNVAVNDNDFEEFRLAA